MAVDDRIAPLVAAAAHRHDALAIGVLAEGEPSFHGRPGVESSLFEIGSVTKAFTGVLLADMTLAGEVRLDDPIAFFLAGAILLGIAIVRIGRPTRWIGVGFAGSLVLFVLGFLLLDIAQPIAGAVFAVVGVVLALRLPNQATPAGASTPA
jgi:Beta-lactamase